MPEYELAVVWAHCASGNSDGYFCSGSAAAAASSAKPVRLSVLTTGFLSLSAEHNVQGSVLSIAPWFGSVRVSAAAWTGDSSQTGFSTHYNTTSDASWIIGGSSASEYTTAFDVLDTIVQTLNECQTSGRFPNLKLITLAGFSAGAQLLNRWSFFNHAEYW
eukprot:SAG31_NODE_11044_length_1072_cov_0.603289_2_plen_161_part_00